MQHVLKFQQSLAAHNDREWFNDHRDQFDRSDLEFRSFVHGLEEMLMGHDHIDPSHTKIYRIYRDVRFSPDKTPYNTHRSVSFKRATTALRGGYYLRVEPGNQTFLAGGFWRPEPADLLHIRKHLQQDPDSLRDILQAPDISNYFGELQGEQVKTAPKGFSKDDPAIDLLRYKGFILSRNFPDKEVLDKNFPEHADDGFRRMRPFLDYMSEILTTDLNGQPITNS